MNEIEYDLLSINGISTTDIENVDEHKHANYINTNDNFKLTCKNWVKNNKTYEIIKYDKSLLTYDMIHKMGLFRSVITHQNKILCYSPPKSFNFNVFMSVHKEEECVAEEFIEGTMINLFYDSGLKKWEIASKTTVGCNVTFNKDTPTFSELFYEICDELNVNFEEQFSKECCYSFVMQHPKNKFVIPIIEKKLYLIAIYKIDNETHKVTEMPRHYNIQLLGNILLPATYYFTSYNEMIDLYGSMNTPIHIMGIVIRHKNGVRTKIRNPNYEYIKNIRGNVTKLQYQYLCLRKFGQIESYLYYFPENKKQFSVFKDQLHLFTDNLHTNYIKCFIKKEKSLKEFPYQFRTHMYNLHQYYLSIREYDGYINKPIIINYINNLESARLMYSLNYHLREQVVLNPVYNERIETQTNPPDIYLTDFPH